MTRRTAAAETIQLTLLQLAVTLIRCYGHAANGIGMRSLAAAVARMSTVTVHHVCPATVAHQEKEQTAEDQKP
jgi:hypothetical protein